MRGKDGTVAGHIACGKKGEDRAAAYLAGLGFTLLERNWRPQAGPMARGLELDLVAREGDSLIFVEVKTRAFVPRSLFSPLDAFNQSKRSRLLRAASLYLEARGLWSCPCRFDLICVLLRPDEAWELEHFKHVLNFGGLRGGALAGGHSPWQPW